MDEHAVWKAIRAALMAEPRETVPQQQCAQIDLEPFRERLGDTFKVAADLAEILNDDSFNPSCGGDVIHGRVILFDALRHSLERYPIRIEEIPSFEVETLEAYIREFAFGFDQQSVLARVNLEFAKAGLPNVHIGERSSMLGGGLKIKSCGRPFTIAIVDDERWLIAVTVLALAGAADATIRPVCVCNERAGNIPFAEVAEQIMQMAPDIVLMDKCMPEFGGAELIRELCRRGSRSIFVGNTNGDPAELHDAGAIGNCEKGRDLQPVSVALRQLTKQL